MPRLICKMQYPSLHEFWQLQSRGGSGRTIAKRYNCEARQHKGRRQKPLTLFCAEYLLPPFRQGAGVGATFAPMSLFNNKTQNILALMHDFYCIL